MTTENKIIAQYTFDQVAAHLIEQNEKSMSNDIGCAYRGKNGMRCAIGFCISNEDYDPKMEGCFVDMRYGPDKLFTIMDKVSLGYYKNSNFLDDLQVIHDCNLPIIWPAMLKQFAKSYSLDDSIVDIMVNAKLPVPTFVDELTINELLIFNTEMAYKM